MRRSKSTLSSFKLLEDFDHNISNGNLNAEMVCSVYNYLKVNGRSLDENLQSREQLDYYFNEYRNLIRSNHLDLISKCYLLQLIELRAMRWISSSDSDDFYNQKMIELQESVESTVDSSPLKRNASSRYLANQLSQSISSSALNNATNAGAASRHDILKDELMIRNADSGKVMGIRGRRVRLIEELSDTIISFQRVNSGARDRLLQITGSSEEAIKKAKKLILDTIRRNASPVTFDLQGKSATSSRVANNSPAKKENVTFDEDETRNVRSPLEMKGIQRSSSLGYSLAKKDYMITESIDTGNLDEVLKVSSNSPLILTECIQVLTSHFELKKSMKRYLPDFEFEVSFSDSEQSDDDFENEIRRNRQRHSTNTSNDLDSSDFTSLIKGSMEETASDDPAKMTTGVEGEKSTSPQKHVDVKTDQPVEKGDSSVERIASPGRNKSPPVAAGEELTQAPNESAENESVHGDCAAVSSPANLLTYDKQFLLDCSKSISSQATPHNFEEIKTSAGEIIKE